eukprot:gene20718-1114_t
MKAKSQKLNLRASNYKGSSSNSRAWSRAYKGPATITNKCTTTSANDGWFADDIETVRDRNRAEIEAADPELGAGSTASVRTRFQFEAASPPHDVLTNGSTQPSRGKK